MALAGDYTGGLTAEYVRSILRYDPETGDFTWRVNRGTNKVAGTCASRPHGKESRKRLTINHKRYLASRVAWLYMTGNWPPRMVDHKNCDPSDDRFANLRLADKSENGQNMRPRIDNTSGKTGVHWDSKKKKWVAQISINGKHLYLGRFGSLGSAVNVYETAKAELHPFSPIARHPGEAI